LNESYELFQIQEELQKLIYEWTALSCVIDHTDESHYDWCVFLKEERPE